MPFHVFSSVLQYKEEHWLHLLDFSLLCFQTAFQMGFPKDIVFVTFAHYLSTVVFNDDDDDDNNNDDDDDDDDNDDD